MSSTIADTRRSLLHYSLILVIAVLAGLSSDSRAAGWFPTGPSGGPYVFSPDPTVTAHAYASVAHVLYRTADSGAHWTLVHRFDPSVSITAIAPAYYGQNEVYVTAGRQAWKSTDAGVTFSEITPQGVNDELRIVASNVQPALVYAYQRLALFRSDDGGQTWVTTSLNDTTTFFGYWLVPHTTIRDLLFLVNPTLVARSVDGGRTWATVLDVATGLFPQVRTFHMGPDRVVVNLFSQGIAVSDDSGFSFRRIATPVAFTGFEIGPFDPNRWIGIGPVVAVPGAAGGTQTVWESRDLGATWQTRGTFAAAARQANGVVGQTGTRDGFWIFSGANVIRTDDAGTTFVSANNGLRDSAAVPVAAGNALFAATPHGVRRSPDVGDNWSALSGIVPGQTTVGGVSYSPGDAVSVVLMTSPLDPQRLLALDWQQSLLLLSRDAGATWSAANGIQRNSITYPGAIVSNPLNADAFDALLVVQAGGTFGSTGARLVTSTDFGSTTATLPSPSPACPPQQGIQYAIVRGHLASNRLLVGGACGIRYTDDNGTTWLTAQTGQNAAGAPQGGRPLGGVARSDARGDLILALAEDPALPGRWLAGGQGGVLVSTDNGAIWQPIGLVGHPVRAIAFDPALSSHVVAALDDGVWSSSDGGAAWTRLDAGMPQIAVSGVGFAQGALFAATNEGLYRCASHECSAGAPVRTTKIVEFHNILLNHYFIVEEGDESAAIDAGAAGPGWLRTGQSFNGFSFAGTLPDDAGSVCRFYGTPGIGPNSHFYTIFPEECDAVSRDPGWTLESRSILVTGWPATACTPGGCASSCGAGRTPVLRLYNGRFAVNDSNHRYTTDTATYAAMQAQGWLPEGVVFCSPVN